jgi:hypothetical protein
VTNAIKQSRPSKATGPDKLTVFHLKYLGPRGITYLTRHFNESLRKCLIPDIYKSAKVIPLFKPVKSDNDAKSYRPISLLCPAIKILERSLLPIITQHLPLADHQHVFRLGYSTTSALTLLTTDIIYGLNQKKPAHRTIIAALDLTKAFDTVNHRLLINDLLASPLPGSITRWISNYLHGRSASTEFRYLNSKHRMIHTGVPQVSKDPNHHPTSRSSPMPTISQSAAWSRC